MKILSYIIWPIIFITSCQKNPDLTIYTELNNVLENRAEFEMQKRDYIDSLNIELNLVGNNDNAKYFIFQALHRAYYSYKYDSAVFYADEMMKIAKNTQDSSLLYNAQIKTSATLLRAGMLLEVKDFLDSIPASKLHDSLQVEYFYIKAMLYFDLFDKYSSSIYKEKYWSLGSENLKSAIAITKPNSIKHHSLSGLYNLKMGDYIVAAHHYDILFSKYKLTGRQFAVDASTYATVYGAMGYEDKRMNLLVNAAIEDIKIVNRENSALTHIGNKLFEEGKIDIASYYLDIALNDAKLYGAQLRQEQLVQIMPSVEAAKAQIIELQKKRIKTYAILSSLLALVILGVLVLLFRQLRKVSEARTIILKKNKAIRDNNTKLREVNLVKEEYIGFSFKTSSDLIQKLDDYRQSVETKIKLKKYDELSSIINRGNIKQERDRFLESFDRTFLSIFPEFVLKFNKLFSEEDKFMDDNGKILNTELRIFALIRLGIQDSERISQILNYSVNTINTYKSKVKNRSTLNNDDFENEIKKIESI